MNVVQFCIIRAMTIFSIVEIMLARQSTMTEIQFFYRLWTAIILVVLYATGRTSFDN